MYQLMITSCTAPLSLTFTQMNHPLAMGMMLLIQTVLISIITGMVTQSFWFSYILFLVFLGGMLVLFIYITTLASNEMFSISPKSIMMTLGTILITSYLYYKSLYWIIINSNLEMTITPINLITKEMLTPLIKYYNTPTSLITLSLILYLFLTLIAIVKITNIFRGPLRQKN